MLSLAPHLTRDRALCVRLIAGEIFDLRGDGRAGSRVRGALSPISCPKAPRFVEFGGFVNVSFGKQLKKPQVSANAISANFLEIPGKFRAAESETRPIKTNLNKFLVPSVKNALLRIDQANDNLR